MNTEQHLAEIEQQGFTIIPDVIELDLVERLNSALLEIETQQSITPGDNVFEGHHTIRIYNLLAQHEIFQQIPTHHILLPIVEGVLDEGCLVSSLSSISIDPGENAQPIHVDDTLYNFPRPHQPLVCNAMWALTDFTEENGATRIIPGSHKRPSKPDYSNEYETISTAMTKGSLLIWNGSLWHGGGANKSLERRVGIAMNYCAGYLRQQENQQLGIPLETAATFSPRLLQLTGFGTYKGLVGHINKQSPVQALFDRNDGFVNVWDKIG
jgi:ectoine hydroxylase-related dioxygenase (phytanoyl-CoA dioxygenase family)